MTRWRLVVAASAERGPSRLPPKTASAIVEFMIGPLVDNPDRVGKPLLRELSGYLAARRGAYRIIYRINEETRTVEVVRIDHRSRVYRSR
jgi:mRNA-degrading endonuclease RelE of RelBE toxin-antitoxin system